MVPHRPSAWPRSGHGLLSYSGRPHASSRPLLMCGNVDTAVERGTPLPQCPPTLSITASCAGSTATAVWGSGLVGSQHSIHFRDLVRGERPGGRFDIAEDV